MHSSSEYFHYGDKFRLPVFICSHFHFIHSLFALPIMNLTEEVGGGGLVGEWYVCICIHLIANFPCHSVGNKIAGLMAALKCFIALHFCWFINRGFVADCIIFVLGSAEAAIALDFDWKIPTHHSHRAIPNSRASIGMHPVHFFRFRFIPFQWRSDALCSWWN